MEWINDFEILFLEGLPQAINVPAKPFPAGAVHDNIACRLRDDSTQV
jgi:hypothetical protein